MQSLKIPFWLAIFININIVIGGAFFLGVQKITTQCGLFAPLAWLICGFMLMPLVCIFAHLAKRFPQAGGIYVYSQETLGQLWGYISGMTYFIGSVAGSAVLVREFVTQIQKISYVTNFLNPIGLTDLYLEIFITLLFTGFNLLNIEFMGAIQTIFTSLKLIPMIILIVGAIVLFDPTVFTTLSFQTSGFYHALPTVFFAYIGIEACCAVIDKIKNGQQHGGKLLWISFCMIVLTYVILQAAILCIFTPEQTNPFLNILPRLTDNNTLIFWGNGLILSAILVSFLAGFYGVFYYNNWNIYAIAENKNIIGASAFLKRNNNGAPWLCIFLQATIFIIFLAGSKSTEYLLTMSDFGITIAYFLSTLAFIKLFKQHKVFMGFFGLISCLSFTYLVTTNVYQAGFYTLIPFLGVTVTCLTLYRKRTT